MPSDAEREFRTIFGRGRDARRLETWMNRGAEWVSRYGYPLIRMGEDKAGPWWKVETNVVGSAKCHAPVKDGLCMKGAGAGTMIPQNQRRSKALVPASGMRDLWMTL